MRHIQRDINKFDLNPGFADENCDTQNIGPGAYNPRFQWSIKGTKIKPKLSKSLVRNMKRK